MKQSELKSLMKVVRFIVREELKKELPRLVESVLTEKYLRKMVAERSPARKLSLSEVVGDDLRSEEELQNEPPEVLRNDHEGIYQKSPLVKRGDDQDDLQRNESRKVAAKLLAGGDPLMESIFSTVRSEAEEASAPTGMPLRTMANKGLDFSRMQKLNEAMTPAAAPPEQLAERKMKMLEMQRQRLEVPVNGGSPAPRPQPRTMMPEPSVSAPSHLDLPPFEPIQGIPL
jgi:hypothetical protein